MTDAAIGYGTVFERSGDGTPGGVMAAIGKIEDLNLPEMSRDMIDGTHMESPDQHRQFVPGLRDGGELTLEMQFKSGGTGYGQLVADFNDDTVQFYQATVVGGDKVGFYGFVQSVGAAIPMGDKMKASIGFKVTGKPIYTVAP